MKCCGIRKREKQRGIAPKDAETEEAYEENLELYEQLTGSLIMQNPDRAETISQNAAYLQRFVIFYSFVSSSLPRVRKRANVCRRTINIKETQKHEKPLNNQGFSYVFHIVKQRWLGRRDSNSRMQQSKCCVLPLDDAPISETDK